MGEFDSYTIEADGDNWWVIGHGTYDESSVNAGMPRWARLHCADSVDKCIEWLSAKSIKEFTVEKESTRPIPGTYKLPDTPPSDFDPTYCGEEW